jgi:hypothetical protein
VKSLCWELRSKPWRLVKKEGGERQEFCYEMAQARPLTRRVLATHGQAFRTRLQGSGIVRLKAGESGIALLSLFGISCF